MSCLLCGCDKLKSVYAPPSAPGRCLARCAACGILQMAPAPTAGELAAYYQKYDVLGEREPYYQKLWDAGALDAPEGKDIRDRFAWAKGLCGSFGKTLDVGSGPGLFLRLVKADGGEAIGVELNARAAARSADQVGVRVASGTIADVPDCDFDEVVLWDLLEHVRDPRQLAKECAARLKTGGWLFVETPNEGSLLDLVVRSLTRFGITGPASAFYGMHHLVLFRRPTILRLLETEGFAVAEIRGAETAVGRVFRGKGFKDRMMRLGLAGLFAAARLIRKQNKMLIAARKLKNF